MDTRKLKVVVSDQYSDDNSGSKIEKNTPLRRAEMTTACPDKSGDKY